MDCNATREALLALLDGEDPGLPPVAVHRHLAVCAACQAWERDVARLMRTTRAAGTGPAPDLSSVLEALAPKPPPRGVSLLPRLGLVAVALLQLAFAAAAFYSGVWGASPHVGHEVGAWDLALAAGLLLAAWRPTAAGPLVPLVAALVLPRVSPARVHQATLSGLPE